LYSNEKDIKKQFEKFKKDWAMHGVTIMCDSWTDPTGMSIMNFMVYCNGIIFFHKSIDCTGHSQDVNFIYKVRIMLPKRFVDMYVSCYLWCVHVVLTGNPQSCCQDRSRTYCADHN
jgi:hypothetical protein